MIYVHSHGQAALGTSVLLHEVGQVHLASLWTSAGRWTPPVVVGLTAATRGVRAGLACDGHRHVAQGLLVSALWAAHV